LKPPGDRAGFVPKGLQAGLSGLLLLGTSPVLAEGRFSLEHLGWLEGCWDGHSGTRQIEECWSEPAGALMLGYGRSIESSGHANFEFLRIAAHQGQVILIAMPGGAAETEFEATALEDGFARFTNPAHDYPRVIEYRREGRELIASIGEAETIDASTTVRRFRYVLRED